MSQANHTLSAPGRATIVFLCLLMLSFSRCVRAMNLYSYNLDSLVYMATDIVEADLVGPGTAQDAPVLNGKVTDCYKGSLRVGQTVALTEMGFFQKDASGVFYQNSVPLSHGDHVFLFLSKAHAAFAVAVPPGANIYWPAPSGVKLVVDGRVLSFHQFSNPGPYLAVTPALKPPHAPPALAEFQSQLAQSLNRVAALTPLLNGPAAPGQLPRLMELLRQHRADPAIDGGDWIAEVVCTKIANLHDPRAIEEALEITSPQDGWSYLLLITGLGTPPGRDYLLQAVGDEELSMSKRVRLARSVGAAGPVYHSVYTKIASSPSGGMSYLPLGEAENDNGSYLTRLALLALANRQHADLCLTILQSLDSHTRGPWLKSETAIHADEATALPVLGNLSRLSKSQGVKRQADTLSQHYRKSAGL